MFHDKYAVAFSHQCLDGIEEFLDIVKMEARCGFVEDKKDMTLAVFADQERGQFDALRFAA